MKTIKIFEYLKYGLLIAFVTGFLISCKGHSAQLTTNESNLVKDSVMVMMTKIAEDISAKGPSAWLNYFENDPGFFMGSGGELAFKDYPTAKSFIKNILAKMITKISLNWTNVNIDPLTPSFAAIGADFHETIVLSDGKTMSVNGYFTGTAHRNVLLWKLRNLNWAIKPPGKG